MLGTLDGMSHWLSQAVVTPIIGKTGIELKGSPHAPGAVRVVVGKNNATNIKSITASYTESEVVPHFTLDTSDLTLYQHIPMDLGAVRVTNFPVEAHRMGTTIWMNVLTPIGVQLEGEESHVVGLFTAMLCQELGIEATLADFDLGLGQWMTFTGVVLAGNVPHCSMSTPGMVMNAFILGLEEPDGEYAFEEEEPVLELAVVGPETIKITDVVLDPAVKTTVLGEFPGRAVSLGSGGKAVALLREALDMSEGKFDDELEDMIGGYQFNAGMEVTGVLDIDTWEAIDQALLVGDNAELVEKEGEPEPSDN